MQVTIHKNQNGDTRTAPKGVTFEQFQEAKEAHKMAEMQYGIDR